MLAWTPARGGRPHRRQQAGRHGVRAGIDGRLVAVAAEGPLQDPTEHVRKSEKAKSGWDGYVERLAREYRIPLVLLLDGYGGSNSYAGNKGYPFLLSGTPSATLFDLLDQSPVVVGVTGPVAGVAAGGGRLPLLRDDGRRPGLRRLADGSRVTDRGGRGRDRWAPDAHAALRARRQPRDGRRGPLRAGTDRLVLPAVERGRGATVLRHRGPDRSARARTSLTIVPDNRRLPFNAQQVIETVVDRGPSSSWPPATAASGGRAGEDRRSGRGSPHQQPARERGGHGPARAREADPCRRSSATRSTSR